MPTVQIATFPVSDAFLSNPTIFKAPLDVIKTADGHLSSFYGLQVEDQKTGYFVSVWESYRSLIEALKPAAAGKLERHHFVVFTLKPEVSPEKLVPLLEDLGKGLDTSVGAHPPCLWGPSTEDKTKYLLVVGWDTVAAHWEAVKEGTDLHKIVVAIGAVADISIGHSHVTKHDG
ncbi:hypothetical protein DFH09DRAFT_1161925 [Mycena vulgaris]|nr:hypothetical protein DFH09DRAFT_1161925 [Mycena vulgaris]